MPPTSPNLNLSGRLASSAKASLLRNFDFWMVAGIALFATASLSALLSFSDPAIVGLVLGSWFVFSAIFIAHSVRDLRDDPPSIPDIAKWNQYDADVRELATKVQQHRTAKIAGYASTKRVTGDMGWKRSALAYATVSIRSRSFFRETEEGPGESAIASQISGSA
jgi:hypothetical protein